MTRNEPTIEAEVVEIDGVAVQPRPAPKQMESPDWSKWKSWQGRVKKLDSRWWPLWLILGFIAIVLIVAIGMCVAVVWITYKLLVGLVAGFLSLLTPSHELQRR